MKYYTAEDFEVNRLNGAIVAYQKANYFNLTSLNFLNLTQSFIITIGLLVGTLLCGRDVVSGTLTVGDFVLFCTYIVKLYMPLNYFGTYYRYELARFPHKNIGLIIPVSPMSKLHLFALKLMKLKELIQFPTLVDVRTLCIHK